MATPLIQSLFTGSEESDRILLQDTVDQSGRQLLKCCVCHLTKRFSSVHLFLFDVGLHQWSAGLPQDVMKRVIVHDGCSDPLGWNLDQKKPSSLLVHLNDCSPQSLVERLGGECQRPDRVVVIDSVSSLLLHQSPAIVCRIIHALGGHCSVVVCLVHADLHQNHVISQLCHVTSTNIVVQSAGEKSTTSGQNCVCGLCSITHQRKSGKVLRKMEQYTLSGLFTVLSATSYDGKTLDRDTNNSTAEPDPTANLTFDLHLSSKEKEDRSRVVLPYTAVRDGMGVASGLPASRTPTGSGQIYYQPDDVDDFDESDPDDDLDI